ncbi:Arc family DNA-binding protein [Pseudomonas otitidis]|uniref:Arc family DNA-binding protein n=1 Tax=Metapseudomonas otitidis TaxID=319939 RepID=UPI00244A2F22|nr:Arc family DNA-binding protein [Pseudomonas otitidis]MDH1104829.1 Arc family DNA-binding protein [Pseudomonas otitidis]MDH1157116.1 Arc family DNA-binding protein [Pseudomonas otitidis]MDH1164740.1 Arc family DNA-binding protein [Pseudomonas otitidis]
MSRTDPQFNLRIPAELREKVMTAAQENKRSATAEIIARLEDSFLSPEQHESLRNYDWDEMRRLMQSVEVHLKSLDAKGGPEYFAQLEEREQKLKDSVVKAPQTRAKPKK